jgi:hypothetical protein
VPKSLDRDDEWNDRWRRLTDAEIADAWIGYQAEVHSFPPESHPHWWAVDALSCLLDDDPLRALEITFLVGRRSDNPKVLEILGASPIEDLLTEDPTLLDAVAIEVRSNESLRVALRSVWQGAMPDEVWARLQALARESV